MPLAESLVVDEPTSIPAMNLTPSIPLEYEPRKQDAAEEKAVITASAWSMVGYGFSQVLRLANNMALSYLLVPEAFGTMAIVNLVIQGLTMFSDVGVGPCIIQNARGDQYKFLNTAWTIQVIRGFVIAICGSLVAWPIARFYNEPSLTLYISVATLTALINGFASTSIFTLQRHIDLKSLAWLDIRAQLVGSIGMCVYAWFSPSVWALIFGACCSALTHAFLSHRIIPGYRNRFSWDGQLAKEMYRFGRWIFISTLLTFCAMQIDRMMMGKLFDLRQLGIYSFAVAIGMLPRMLVEKLCGSTLYPVLARSFREDRSTMEQTLRKNQEVILVFGIAMTISVLSFCRLFFETLYDADYHPAGAICQWLCIVTWISIVALPLSGCVFALGHTRALAMFNFTRLMGCAVAAMVGHHLAGLEGFIVGLAVGELIAFLMVSFQLYQRGITLIGQDIRLSLAFTAAAALSILVQTCLSPVQSFLVMAALCGGLWIWSLLQIRTYFRSSGEST